MSDDGQRASRDEKAIYGTDDNQPSGGGSRYSLTFKGLSRSSLTLSDAGHVPSVADPEKNDCNERVCVLAKAGYVDGFPSPSNADDEENVTSKCNIDYVEAEGVFTFSQDVPVNHVQTMDISDSISTKNIIPESVFQLFKGYVCNIPTNMPCAGMLPSQANGAPPQAKTDAEVSSPGWSGDALSEPRSVDSMSTSTTPAPAPEAMEAIPPPVNTPAVVSSGYVCSGPVLSNDEECTGCAPPLGGEDNACSVPPMTNFGHLANTNCTCWKIR